jgi:shikimate kinase
METHLPCIDRSIVLVGMPGSGKSSVGKRLARRLGLPFVDADQEIERSCQCTVAEIFERFGEDHFRDGERRVIARLLDGPATVLATGGGAFATEETRTLVLQRAHAVWLDAPIATLAERVRRKDGRPLLRGKDPIEVLTGLAARRSPAYAAAHIRVESGLDPHEAVVERIVEALSGRAG